MPIKKLLDAARQFITPDVDANENDYFTGLKKASQRTQLRVLGEAIERAKRQLQLARNEAGRYCMPHSVKFVATYTKGTHKGKTYDFCLCNGESFTLAKTKKMLSLS
jgi:hypothetical protein